MMLQEEGAESRASQNAIKFPTILNVTFPFLGILLKSGPLVISNKLIFCGEIPGSLPFVPVILFLFYLFLCFALLLYIIYK